MLASSFAVQLSEDAGERSGLALDRQQLVEHLTDGHFFQTAFAGDDHLMRVASDEYADAVGDLLFAVGAAAEPGMPTLGQRLMKRLGPEWRSRFSIDEMLETEAVALHHLRQRNETGKLDRAALNSDLENAIGGRRNVIMDDLLAAMEVELAQSPYFTRHTTSSIALTALFESEQLPIAGSGFFDQRFANYLSGKPELLQEIHWRQFEGLTAEWLARSGYKVELGPGRDDGSVDVRAWKNDVEPGTPPVLIVQCKREKRKVGKVVVKALWADVHDERADAGLIVTTNDISPGAAKVIEARAYPVTVANRNEVMRWLAAMRKPAAGICL
ncbi:restriction endonuclease [Bradyrhizobium australafricanum]|uniref:restriction endonuclease n=1 Tax=Bradyrhizobium australafricanum TaxID=2821406 RepID=UPI001CE260C9|nr:restriction endonuclease [Bradyrhizobium australafricanum]MCA6097635.1 restriction endonuclease [Bradyrhizobium australafricanum]